MPLLKQLVPGAWPPMWLSALPALTGSLLQSREGLGEGDKVAVAGDAAFAPPGVGVGGVIGMAGLSCGGAAGIDDEGGVVEPPMGSAEGDGIGVGCAFRGAPEALGGVALMGELLGPEVPEAVAALAGPATPWPAEDADDLPGLVAAALLARLSIPVRDEDSLPEFLEETLAVESVPLDALWLGTREAISRGATRSPPIARGARARKALGRVAGDVDAGDTAATPSGERV